MFSTHHFYWNEFLSGLLYIMLANDISWGVTGCFWVMLLSSNSQAMSRVNCTNKHERAHGHCEWRDPFLRMGSLSFTHLAAGCVGSSSRRPPSRVPCVQRGKDAEHSKSIWRNGPAYPFALWGQGSGSGYAMLGHTRSFLALSWALLLDPCRSFCPLVNKMFLDVLRHCTAMEACNSLISIDSCNPLISMDSYNPQILMDVAQ